MRRHISCVSAFWDHGFYKERWLVFRRTCFLIIFYFLNLVSSAIPMVLISFYYRCSACSVVVGLGRTGYGVIHHPRP